MGVERSRTAIHEWVKKADLQPEIAATPNQIAVGETVIRVNGRQEWLCAAVDPESGELLHVRLFQALTTERTLLFLRELQRKYTVQQAEFSSTVGPFSVLHSTVLGSDFRQNATEIGMLSNVSFVR